MDKIEINGQRVKVLADGIQKYGRLWTEIEEYPTIVMHTKLGDHVYSEDWVVLEDTGKFCLYMNNNHGFMVLIEFEQNHFEENRGYVVDKPGHIYYTSF